MDLTFLVSDEGAHLLEEISKLQPPLRDANFLKHLTVLRKEYPQIAPEIIGAALEVFLLRQRAEASGKFELASRLFFTKSGLEQASSQTIADYRASRFAETLPKNARIADLGCGLGSDSLALARRGFFVTGVDLDGERLIFARTNARVLGLHDQTEFVEQDITTFEVAGFDGIFFDPARRTESGKRLFSVEAYQPPLSLLRQWQPKVPNIAVKISPGVDYAELAEYACEIEIISEAGDVKEAVLWFGDLRSQEDSDFVRRRATLLPQKISLTAELRDSSFEEVVVGEPLQYLFEPDGAVIRAGLVEELAHLMGYGTRKIDEDIAFLTSDFPVETAFARRFTIRETLPFNLKKLNRRLQELNVGRVTVKKRGSPLDPQQLEQALKLKGSAHVTLILTHVQGKPFVLICD